MKHLAILAIALHRVTYIRSRCAVYFGMSLFVPSIICMYWVVALKDNPTLGVLYQTDTIVTYYLVAITLSALLISHLKDEIMKREIQRGYLSQALLKPYPYYWYMFVFHEFPYRLVQGAFGILVIIAIAIFAPTLLSLPLTPFAILWGAISCILGFFICFNLELILGALAFWFYDLKLVYNAYEVVFILLGGMNMPLFLLPDALEKFVSFTPFPSIIYSPTLIVIGRVHELSQVFSLIFAQLFWIAITTVMYIIIWKKGIKIYSASGQ